MILSILLPVTALYALLGLLIGSFLNVCIYRIPRGESVAAGRSHCPACGHVLAPLDLVPIASYLLLGKRCRYCQAAIAPRYTQVEALTALFFAFSGFALTALGLLRNILDWRLLLIPFLDVGVLSVVFTWLMIRFDRKATTRAVLGEPGESGDLSEPGEPGEPHPSPAHLIQLFLAGDLLHIWLLWLALG